MLPTFDSKPATSSGRALLGAAAAEEHVAKSWIAEARVSGAEVHAPP